LCKDLTSKFLKTKHSPFKAGYTLNVNAVFCAASLVVINYLLDHKLAENSKARGEQFRSGLANMMNRHPSLGDVRGRGLLDGFELVKSRETKESFEPSKHASVMLESAALKRGLVTYPCTGSIDGMAGDMVLMAPPLVINTAEIDEILSILDDSLTEVETSLGVK
jgi:adenosylmethionine-8-amino-7-oxononanoate aminotransferase